jgi:hypothetical protein
MFGVDVDIWESMLLSLESQKPCFHIYMLYSVLYDMMLSTNAERSVQIVPESSERSKS